MPGTPTSFHRPRPGSLQDLPVLAALAAVVLVLGVLGTRSIALGIVTGRIRHAAGERGLTARWGAVRLGFPMRVGFERLTLEDARADTVFHADSLDVRVNPWSLLILRPRLAQVALSRAWMRMGGASADPDTLLPEEPRPAKNARASSERVKRAAQRLARLLLAPARDLPGFTLRDVVIESGGGDGELIGGVRIASLDLESSRRGIALAARGNLSLERALPFDLRVDYGHDDRLVGGARILISSPRGAKPEPLQIALDGRITQDHGAREVRLEEGSRLTLGKLPFILSGSVSQRGPRVKLSVTAERLTQQLVVQSLPRAVFGSLLDLAVKGSFDYRLALDLDFERPDDVDFTADVIPHGLRLDPARTRLNLLSLDQPFLAAIHLPRGVTVYRELSPANPDFRPIEEIDSLLTDAVVTNEDGSFFRHRGFNTEAVKMAIAANLKAGAFRRGAGTITMQLVRNLYLGHEKTLSRKAQEVVLAWVLENLTGIGKRRLLEIYMNIIEWGPGVHGANEAARYYFDHDARRFRTDEALFLSTVVPAPRKWHYRFGSDGELRRYARAQMHFIGRAMIAKGWLLPEALPPADSLRVELRGPARAVVAPPPDTLHMEPVDGESRSI